MNYFKLSIVNYILTVIKGIIHYYGNIKSRLKKLSILYPTFAGQKEDFDYWIQLFPGILIENNKISELHQQIIRWNMKKHEIV
jgi:hypothetical protein